LGTTNHHKEGREGRGLFKERRRKMLSPRLSSRWTAWHSGPGKKAAEKGRRTGE